MPDIQEVIALGIVALVAGRLLWKRWARRQAARSGDCGDCAAAGPAPKEATVRFYRRRTPEPPAGDAGQETPPGDDR